MNYDSVWQPNTGSQWLQALALPVQPWVKIFLEQMKFPLDLASDTQIFQDIYTRAVEKRAALVQANKGYSPELDAAITRKFVTEALEQIEAKVNFSAAEAFKNWAHQNLICSELTSALLAWRVILRHACGQGNPKYILLSPPKSLIPLLPKIADLVSYERDQKIHEELRRLSPPYKDEEGLGLDISPQAMTVEEIVRNESTRDALRCIADSLSKSEREEMVAWAEEQGAEQNIPPSLLYGAILLK